MKKYEKISHPNVHIDISGVININGQNIKIAVEYNGKQHYDFPTYEAMIRKQDIGRGIYKTTDQYLEQWNALVARDNAKEELFRELNSQGYYLVVVPYLKKAKVRVSFIWNEFLKQFKRQTQLTDF